MSNICRACGSEKRYDEYHKLYKPCDSCNSKRALTYYHNKKDERLDEKKYYYQNYKEFFREQNRKRINKITDLVNQINIITEMIICTISVA